MEERGDENFGIVAGVGRVGGGRRGSLSMLDRLQHSNCPILV